MAKSRTLIGKPSTVHVDRALSNLSIATAQSADRFIATQVFPEVEVEHKTDEFYEWLRDFWHRSVMGEKVAGSNAPRHSLGIKTQQYNALGYWLEAVLDRDTVANEDAAVNQEQAYTEWLTYQALLNREIKFAADFFKTGVWGTSNALSGTDQWSDFDDSNPITDSKTSKQTVEKNTGQPPNTLVINAEVWDNGLSEHPLILDKFKHTQRGILTRELVAPVLDVDRILVARAIRNTAVEKAEGTESYTGAYIFGKNALFVNVVPGVGLLQPAAGKTFKWNPNGLSMQIERYEEERSDADILRIRDYFDQKITSKEHGYMFTSAVA